MIDAHNHYYKPRHIRNTIIGAAAIYGGEYAYNYLTKKNKMAPINRGRSGSRKSKSPSWRNVTPVRRGIKHERSSGSKRKTLKRPKVITPRNLFGGKGKVEVDGKNRVVENEDGAMNVVPVVARIHTHNSSLEKPKKKVKVPKLLRQQIKQIEAAPKFHGWKKDIYFLYSAGVPNDGQAVFNFGSVPLPAYSSWDFLPEYFLDAASVLFANKTSSAAGWSHQSIANIGTGVPPTGGGNIYANNVQFTIKNSWVKYLYRNNTQRTVIMDLYECAPKVQSYITNSPPNLNGLAVPTADALIDPMQWWDKCLTDDFVQGLNLNNVTKSLLGTRPEQTTAWKKAWEYNVTRVVLEPGASYEYFLQGPSGKDFKFSKHVKNNTFNTIQKYSRFLMPVYHMDVAPYPALSARPFGRPGLVGPLAAGTQTSPVFFGFERTLYCDVTMPEQTGFNYPAAFVAGVNQQLGFRRSTPFSMNMWNTGTSSIGAISDLSRQTMLPATLV